MGHFYICFYEYVTSSYWLKMNVRVPHNGGSCSLAMPTNECGHGTPTFKIRHEREGVKDEGRHECALNAKE